MSLAEAGAALEQLSDLEELWGETVQLLRAEGFNYAIYLTVDADRTSPFLLTTIPEIYAEAPPETDPFLDYCCHTYEPTLTGGDYLPRYDYLPDEAKVFIRRAAKLAFSTGFGFPMRLEGSGRFGGFNIGTRLSIEEFEERYLSRIDEFRFFCLLLHRRFEELSSEQSATPTDFRSLLIAPKSDALENLSPREKEVIYLVARGVSRKEAARLCGISPNTVAEYIQNAYRKLGVRNRAEAANLIATAPA